MTQLERNRRSMNKHIDQIIEQYSKVLSIRIDLYFMDNSLEEYTIHDLQYYFQKFIKAVKNSKDLKDYIAYFRVFELGNTKGVHCHCLFMYNGQKRRNDYWIGRQLGELWQRVTKGKGGYYNANSAESKEGIRRFQTTEQYRDRLEKICTIPAVRDEAFEETKLGLANAEFNTLGIGMLKRSDNIGWLNVRELADYFTKLDQSFSREDRAGVRVFSQSSKLR